MNEFMLFYHVLLNWDSRSIYHCVTRQRMNIACTNFANLYFGHLPLV